MPNDRKHASLVIDIVIITLLGLAVVASHAQTVYRCNNAGQTTYSDKPCTKGNEQRFTAKPNTLNASDGREQVRRELWRNEQERAYWAEQHARQREAAQLAIQSQADAKAEQHRKDLLREATTRLPGAHGLTRNQREAAAALARTPEERRAVMREATIVMPGARGLTASQRDTARRLTEVEHGRPLPAPAAPPPSYTSPSAALDTPEPPGLVVNCDGAGCWDTSGRRLNNAAGGNFTRSDGKFCTRAGPNVICN